jgi:N-acetyl-alpha-D-glucosaminyl L-malate synthase BshA
MQRNTAGFDRLIQTAKTSVFRLWEGGECIMRIGIMCHASFGGSARVATELAIGLAQRNHQVHLFTRTLPFGEWDRGNGVHVHTAVPEWANDEHPARLLVNWSESELLAFVAHVTRVAIREKLDALHFHYAVPFAEVALKVQRYMEPLAPVLVGTLHGTDVSIHGRSPEVGLRLSRLLSQVDALTTVSENYAQLSNEVFQLPEPPQVIPNFVDLTRFYPQNPLEPRDPDRPRLIHISNFRPVKDAQSLARIFVDIRKQIDAELWLVGDGPEMPAVRTIFQQCGIERDVYHWGLQQDVAPILAQADLLLMTSLNESFSLVALEAQACGVPVVSTSVGGLPEVVLDGQSGGLFPQGDHDTAVELALGILRNPDLYQRMRAAAIQQAQKFSWEAVMPRYEALYRELLYQRSGVYWMQLQPTASQGADASYLHRG